MASRLDDLQRAILRAFLKLDPNLEYQHNVWSPPLVSAVRTEAEGIPRAAWWERELPSLTRRGLLAAEGRGRYRQYGLTEAGKEAIADA